MNSNYGGRQPDSSAYIKTFFNGTKVDLWIPNEYKKVNVIQPSNSTFDNVYIPGNLYVDGIIVNNKIKENSISFLQEEESVKEKLFMEKIKSISFQNLEVIPLLEEKIKNMQIQIEALKDQLNSLLLEEKW